MTDIAGSSLDLVWLWTSLGGIAVGILTFILATGGNSLAPIVAMVTVPLQRTVLVGDGGVQLTWTQVALAGFFGGVLLLFLRGGLQIPIDVITLASFAVIGVYGLTVLVTHRHLNWAGEVYRWTVALAFLALARPYAVRAGASRNLAIGLGTMAVTAMATGVIQASAGAGPGSFERSGITRAYAAFGEPNPFGAFAVMVTVPCIALVVLAPRRRSSHLGAFAAVAGAAGIIAVASSQSRGAMLGLAAGLAVIAIVWWIEHGRPFHHLVISSASACAAIGIVAVAVAFSGAGPRDEVTSDCWPDRERQAHWGAATRMILDHPVLGTGAGSFSDEFRNYTTEWRFRISQGHAHNAYLQVAAETGITGLVAYLALLTAIVWRLLVGARTMDGRWRCWAALAVSVSLMVHGLFDYLHVLSLGIVLSGIWAYGLAGASRGVAPVEHNSSL